MKHIILGDVHLGRSLNIGKPASGKNLNSRVQDQLDLLHWVEDLASADDCKHVVITGDVYHDPRPHPAIINLFMSFLKQGEDKGIKYDIVAGNHDILRTGNYVLSALDLVPTVDLNNAKSYKNPKTLNFDNCTFSFLPFRDKRMYEAADTNEALSKLAAEMNESLELDENKKNILVGHLALEKSLSVGDEISDQTNELFVPLDMFDKFDYVWMGHIHHYQVLKEEGPHICHIGSMDRSDFSTNEIDKDKYIVIYDDVKSDFELVKIPTRSLIKERVSVPADQDSTDFVINDLCLKDKKNSFKDSIFRLEIELNGQDTLSVDRAKIEDYLYNNLKVHHVSNFSELRMLVDMSDSDLMLDTAVDDPKEDLKNWTAAHKDDFEDDEEKELFNAFAAECIADYEADIA